MLDPLVCQKARLSRDARFDGKFFTAVNTTKIYCRSICPVYPPKEQNVVYFPSAILAANAGFRPCLRCRPDSAPGSPAWKGVGASLERAIRLIEQGYLQHAAVPELAQRLGITDRYLRKLFSQQLGVSPKQFALYQQCLFAKKLLHQTQLSITHIALASGFDSVRRFNDCFKKNMKLTPSQMRNKAEQQDAAICLDLYYRPPFNWHKMVSFLRARLIPDLEWADQDSYGRCFQWQGATGRFTAQHVAKANKFVVEIEIDDLQQLQPVITNIRRILDLDVDIAQVEQDLNQALPDFPFISGLRLPGIWQVFEAGIRAILGQQISVLAAKNLVIQLVQGLGEKQGNDVYFPTPQAIAQSDLAFLKMPQARKQTLIRFAQYVVDDKQAMDPDTWLALKGIGPWTVDYAKLRGLSDPDILLASDLGVKKALNKQTHDWQLDNAAPWRSYLTFQLWQQLAG